ncbi:hypothetical protein GCM10008935_23670 [Alkalibacillus silvisoli]|uniref:Gram-positive cocci surface proteins LPxTG domain-containing protein n=1 Tax=Alkalibacillus silvisoli TaxID=392823 RepID=A0ABN1A3Y7_9BACI
MRAKSYFIIAKIIVLTLFLSSVFGHINQVNADETDEEALSISTIPSEVLFDVTNIKPGDTFTRTSTLINDGELDFYYQTEAIQTEGSEKLFNQLELVVYDSEENIIFDGQLADFEGFEPKMLASGEEEEITYLAEFPWESGNEFQGLETEFNIVTWADAEPIEPGTPSEDAVAGGILPQTGEEIPYFYYIIGGLIVLTGVALYLTKRKNRLVGDE